MKKVFVLFYTDPRDPMSTNHMIGVFGSWDRAKKEIPLHPRTVPEGFHIAEDFLIED
jgi:hypothetical protein